MAAILSFTPDETRAAIMERLREEVTPYTTSQGLELPGLVLLASARRN